MGLLLKIAVGLLIWLLALFGVLQIGLASGLDAHGHSGISICGPWGCGPPISALVGWHGFWLVLVAPPVGLLVRVIYARQLWWLGLAISGGGLLAILAICLHEAVTWLPMIADGEPTYFVRRCLFAIATATDVPAVPVTLSGLVLVAAGIVKSRSRQPAAGANSSTTTGAHGSPFRESATDEPLIDAAHERESDG